MVIQMVVLLGPALHCHPQLVWGSRFLNLIFNLFWTVVVKFIYRTFTLEFKRPLTVVVRGLSFRVFIE
jgi:hypothetical protein